MQFDTLYVCVFIFPTFFLFQISEQDKIQHYELEYFVEYICSYNHIIYMVDKLFTPVDLVTIMVMALNLVSHVAPRVQLYPGTPYGTGYYL